MDRREGTMGRTRSRDNETFGGIEAESAVWHQADHPSAANFEEERLKRHHGGEQNPRAPSASVESDPGNGASNKDAGEDFNAGAYAFFGDPSSSGLELELGGLEEDAGVALAHDDEGGVKGLEGEEEVDIEELRDEDNEQQVAQAFAKLTTSDGPPAPAPWQLVDTSSSTAPASTPAPAQPAWWPRAEGPAGGPQESWDWHVRQLQAQQAQQQQLQQGQGLPAGTLSVEQLEASLRQGQAHERTQGYPAASGAPPNRGPPGFSASRPASFQAGGPPLPHYDQGRPQFRGPPLGPVYGGSWAQPSPAHLAEPLGRTHSPQPLPPAWGDALSSQALLHLHALQQQQQQQASVTSLPPPYAHEQGPSGGPYYGGAAQLRPQRAGGDGQPHYGSHQSGPAERRPGVMPSQGQGYGALQQQGYLGRPNYRSKYMSHEEVEAIVRMQWSATHPQDPYTDDYYHQASQAKADAATPHGRRHFAPSHLREGKATAEPHAFLQVEGLGRIPFSSIRRPRPLLEVSAPPSNKDGSRDTLTPPPPRPLEQEPMLAARIAIEDGMCLLLDVDDINRLLTVSQPPDGGLQLRRRKQILLEGLAASLQLSDAADHSGGRELSDLVFLRLVSLPKGRKLIARYLQLLPRGSDLSRTVVLAIMRHLRFLFGGAHADPGTATSLAGSVAAAISSLDLAALSACLATALGAVEYPPLRPLRSVNGDGATVVLLAVLDRASVLLSGHEGGALPSAMAQEIWQSNFDSFFGLLAKHCSAKFEAIAAAAEAGGGMNAAAAAAIGAEVPVELLRSSLPHTNDNQRAFLLDTIRKTVAAGGFAHGGREMQPSTAAVHG